MNTTRRSVAVAVLVWLATAVLSAAAARAADPSADVSAEPSTTALPAGGRGMVAVVIDVHDGLHAQSHTPADPSYIPLVITPKPVAGVTFGEVRYPRGEDHTYPELGKLNVYVDRVIAYLPVAVAADAKAGPVDVAGTVDLQACNRSSCFPPESIPFDVKVNVVAAGGAVRPNHPELFTGPDAAVPGLPPAPATRPTTAPAAAAVAPPGPPATATTEEPTWLARHLRSGGLPVGLAAAFVIGILFNAVPCVLPVLPLKIMGFYEVSQHSRGRCLFLGTVFGAGLVSVFAVLAVLIFGLHVIDWGGLFQHTWFTVAITAVLLAMAAGTFGLFDVALPAGVYNLSPRHDTVAGNFGFGILTAVLSTPCTFGVFAGLLAWAITQPPAVGAAVLVMVGVGMASPYVVLSAVPEVARHFPRTGPWAALVKQEMGFVLLAMAVYFAQPLLGRVMPITATWWLMFAAVAAAGAYAVGRSVQLSPTARPPLVVGGIALAVVAVSLGVTRRFTSHPYQWQPYTPAALAAATAAGHPVVIDFTATWCGNCHWLEGTVLHDQRVVSAVNRDDVVMMQADVTRGDAVGQPLLNRLNPTHAIPLTAVYAPHAAADSRPALLDGIYSVDDLVGTLSRVTAQ